VRVPGRRLRRAGAADRGGSPGEPEERGRAGAGAADGGGLPGAVRSDAGRERRRQLSALALLCPPGPGLLPLCRAGARPAPRIDRDADGAPPRPGAPGRCPAGSAVDSLSRVPAAARRRGLVAGPVALPGAQPGRPAAAGHLDRPLPRGCPALRLGSAHDRHAGADRPPHRAGGARPALRLPRAPAPRRRLRPRARAGPDPARERAGDRRSRRAVSVGQPAPVRAGPGRRPALPGRLSARARAPGAARLGTALRAPGPKDREPRKRAGDAGPDPGRATSPRRPAPATGR
jgi:hypothetical protein